jgi:hypothetical protein
MKIADMNDIGVKHKYLLFAYYLFVLLDLMNLNGEKPVWINITVTKNTKK